MCEVPQGVPLGYKVSYRQVYFDFFPDFFLASLLMPSQGPSKAQDGPVKPSEATLEQLRDIHAKKGPPKVSIRGLQDRNPPTVCNFFLADSFVKLYCVYLSDFFIRGLAGSP